MIAGCTTSDADLSSYRLLVHLLPANSGKSALVEACRDVSDLDNPGLIVLGTITLPFQLSSASSPISVSDISNHLAKKYSLSDPELLIQVGVFAVGLVIALL